MMFVKMTLMGRGGGGGGGRGASCIVEDYGRLCWFNVQFMQVHIVLLLDKINSFSQYLFIYVLIILM